MPLCHYQGMMFLSKSKISKVYPRSKVAHVKMKLSHEQRGDNWNKKSIFFKLAYWKTLLLRHNLDVMHIEKNVCDIILGTLMNMKGKTKDNVKSRLD